MNESERRHPPANSWLIERSSRTGKVGGKGRSDQDVVHLAVDRASVRTFGAAIEKSESRARYSSRCSSLYVFFAGLGGDEVDALLNTANTLVVRLGGVDIGVEGRETVLQVQ